MSYCGQLDNVDIMSPMREKHITIVEDERDMAELIAMRLTREHYSVDIIHDGLEALEAIQSDCPDLVLLDLMLPGMSGMDVTKELRENSRTANVPIIMLTARGEESDVIVGLHVGADDYITKPFSMSVLMARIEAVLRRVEHVGVTNDKVFTVGPITIDNERYTVEVDGKPISLTLTEFRLLTSIITADGRVLTRSQLIDKVLGRDTIVTDRTIDVHATALRRKLGNARKYIQTVRGVGYRLGTHDDETT